MCFPRYINTPVFLQLLMIILHSWHLRVLVVVHQALSERFDSKLDFT